MFATAPDNADDKEPEWLRTECCSCVREVVGKAPKIFYSAEETSAFRLRYKQRAAAWREVNTGKVGERKSAENDKSDKNGAYFNLSLVI